MQVFNAEDGRGRGLRTTNGRELAEAIASLCLDRFERSVVGLNWSPPG
jgi:hypothetical protein